ncbi:hypothetical protein CHS0354_018609, partial [Potamilus streckersoni]
MQQGNDNNLATPRKKYNCILLRQEHNKNNNCRELIRRITTNSSCCNNTNDGITFHKATHMVIFRPFTPLVRLIKTVMNKTTGNITHRCRRGRGTGTTHARPTIKTGTNVHMGPQKHYRTTYRDNGNYLKSTNHNYR